MKKGKKLYEGKAKIIFATPMQMEDSPTRVKLYKGKKLIFSDGYSANSNIVVMPTN